MGDIGKPAVTQPKLMPTSRIKVSGNRFCFKQLDVITSLPVKLPLSFCMSLPWLYCQPNFFLFQTFILFIYWRICQYHYTMTNNENKLEINWWPNYNSRSLQSNMTTTIHMPYRFSFIYSLWNIPCCISKANQSAVHKVA